MVNENSAKFCAIQKVFGLDFVTSKVVSCQMPYKNDVNRVSFRIGPSYRDLFKSICHEICSIATVAEYNEKRKWLDEIANIFPNISQWLTWWDARKYHMFPVFRCHSYLNVTLAESSNLTLKCHMQLWLLEAALNDTSTVLTQVHEFNSFLTQVSSSNGKGPSSLTYNRANRATQICTDKAFVTEFSNMHAHSEGLEENTNPQVFVPSGGARHRPVKTKTGIERTFV